MTNGEIDLLWNSVEGEDFVFETETEPEKEIKKRIERDSKQTYNDESNKKCRRRILQRIC